MKGRDEGNMSDRLYFKGALVRDDDEFLCLTDMWKAAGGDSAKRPGNWVTSAQAKEFAEFLDGFLTARNSGSLTRTTEGRNGGTWAHWQLAMAYAKYLSPEFHAWCNDVVRKVMNGEPAAPAADPSAVISGVAATLTPALERIANVVRDMGVAFAERLDSMQRQIDEMKKGGLGAVVTKAQADFLLSECRLIAATFYTGKQAKSVKAALCSVHNRLRKELEWFGTGRSFRMLPATRYADALVELTALRREAIAASQAVSNARQTTLDEIFARGAADEGNKADSCGSGEKH